MGHIGLSALLEGWSWAGQLLHLWAELVFNVKPRAEAGPYTPIDCLRIGNTLAGLTPCWSRDDWWGLKTEHLPSIIWTAGVFGVWAVRCEI